MFAGVNYSLITPSYGDYNPGIFTYANGDVYEGEYRDGNRYGNSRFIFVSPPISSEDLRTKKMTGYKIIRYS
jgi:hypothetical protein